MDFSQKLALVHRQSGFKGRMANRSSTAAGLTLALLLAALTLPGGAFAEVEGYPDPAPKPQFSLTVTPVYQFPAHLGGGGTLRVTGVLVSADVVKQFDRDSGWASASIMIFLTTPFQAPPAFR
jgi:hypothetical protein